MKKLIYFGVFWTVLLFAGTGIPAEVPISDSTAECLDCHSMIHPGIVNAWQKSRHAQITPKKALVVDKLSRRVSSQNVPESLQNVAVPQRRFA